MKSVSAADLFCILYTNGTKWKNVICSRKFIYTLLFKFMLNREIDSLMAYVPEYVTL